jgi:hypothetical protein
MWRTVSKQSQTSGQILATTYSRLYSKPTNKEIIGIIDLNKDNEIVPAQLRLAEMSTKKLSKKNKEEKTPTMDNRKMSVHAKLPELNESDWLKQSRKELQEALTDDKITVDDYNREIANLDEPIYGSGKTTDTQCVAQIGNYMVIDSGLNGDCLYAAVIQSNDTMFKWGKPFEGELPERARELRERTYRHLQDRYKNRQHLKQETLLQKLLNDVDEEFDSYMSYVAGETSPPAGALEICALADLMLSDIEIHRPTVMKATLTKYLDTETGALRKIKLLLHNNHYCCLQELDRYANLEQTMGIPHLFSYLKEEDITPVQTLCAGHTQEFRTKMQQSLATWKSQAAMSSFRPTSLLNILPQGDEEQLRAQHRDILKNISMLQTMVRMAASEHDREATRSQVQALKASETLISKELRRITEMQQAAQSKKEKTNEIRQQDEPPDRSKSPDLVFETIDVIASHNIISPDHINMLSQTHSTLDRRLSGRLQITPQAIHTEVDEEICLPEQATSPDFVITVHEAAINPQHQDVKTNVRDGVKEIDDTLCNFPLCDRPKWHPHDFCGNTHAMMAGAKAIDDSHRDKGVEQTHTWNSMTKTCTPIVYSQAFVESEDEVQDADDDADEKGSSDDEPDDSTLASVKKIPRRSLFMEEMTMPLPRPHNTPEKNALVPDMTDDNLEACMTKTQDLIQDTINNLFAMTEKLTRMKNSVKATGDDELYGKTPRSVLELNYKFLEMRFNEALAHNMELLQTLQESLEEQDNLRNGQRLSNDASELQQQLDIKRAECDKLRQANTQLKNDTVKPP